MHVWGASNAKSSNARNVLDLFVIEKRLRERKSSSILVGIIGVVQFRDLETLKLRSWLLDLLQRLMVEIGLAVFSRGIGARSFLFVDCTRQDLQTSLDP